MLYPLSYGGSGQTNSNIQDIPALDLGFQFTGLNLTPEELSKTIAQAMTQVLLRSGHELKLPGIVVERPKNRDHGDWATNIAMQISKQIGLNPRELGAQLALELAPAAGVEKAEVAGPGFVNIFLSAASAGSIVAEILRAGDVYGSSDLYTGLKLNLEFVSANPTGPIHLGGSRWAAAGDSLARMLSFQGADVTKEYYFNDHGAQIDRFAQSLLARARGEMPPEDGYGGEYITDIATKVLAKTGDQLLSMDTKQAQEAFRAEGVELMFSEIKSSLIEFGVNFDVYFHENSLHESDAVSRAIQRLRANGHIFEEDGAIWLRSTAFGDDRDRVVIKSDGESAYIAADLAYYLDKRERGFDRAIIMLGADHHGYVQRMMAMCAAFGDKPGENLEILIGQMVNLVKDGQPVRMSKRAGTVVTMEDLVEAVGVDAARYSLTRSSANSQVDIDLDLLTRKTNENPVFYVQYAHARTCQVFNNASSLGIVMEQFQPQLLSHETESVLIAKLAEFPRTVSLAAESREPHRVARYLEDLAASYHRWYDSCRVTPIGSAEIEPVHQSRLWLNQASAVVLRNGLELLGVSAPERM